MILPQRQFGYVFEVVVTCISLQILQVRGLTDFAGKHKIFMNNCNLPLLAEH